MSVLVQPALAPAAGGWAKISPDGTVVVRGVKGSPAPLLQGWVSGAEARFDGSWKGEELVDLMGLSNLDSVRHLLVTNAIRIGADSCEWALTDRIWALQFTKTAPPPNPPQVPMDGAGELSGLTDFVKVMVLAPGPLGEHVVLPWAVAGLPDAELPMDNLGNASVAEIRALCRKLTAEVWGLDADAALRSVQDLMDRLIAGETDHALEVLDGLNRPDALKAARLLGNLRTLRRELVSRGIVPDQRTAWQLHLDSIERALGGEPAPIPSRTGVGRWEPLLAAVVLTSGRINTGTPASPGIGVGLRAHTEAPHETPEASRGVITATQPTPALAPLLWDASAVVTATGSPGAHLFEAARSLHLPAVCGIDLGQPRNEIIAVDGYTGMVATLALDREI
jgi:hypothetical protein